MVEVSAEQKENIHKFYLASRALFSSGVVPPINIQRSFEEMINGFRGAVNTWRPTHISRSAIKELFFHGPKNVQRAHGVLTGRKDRFVRTTEILSGPELPFEEWWKSWDTHDATVLITRDEHGSGKIFDPSEVILIPSDPPGMFVTAGFSFKIRKSVEMVWVEQVVSDLCLTSEQPAAAG